MQAWPVHITRADRKEAVDQHRRCDMATKAIEPGAGRAAVVRQTAGAARRGWQIWRNRMATRQLLALDDRILRDIGLSRFDVLAALSGPWWEDPMPLLHQRALERRGVGRRR
jgi:uncharacterized protein YjiS (DUF1127 family)